MTGVDLPPDQTWLPPDDRVRLFIRGFDDAGRPLPLTVEALRETTTDWPVREHVPAEISDLLSTSRDLFVHAWFHYEFLVVAAAWSLLAVEAAMRHEYPTREAEPLKRILAQAHQDGLLTHEQHDRLRAGAKLRNRLLHATEQSVWTFGMAAGVLASSHAVVADLFDRKHFLSA